MTPDPTAATLGCDEARTLMPLVPVDALEPDERAELDAHLAICAACALEARKVSEAMGAVARLGARRAPPPEVWAKLVQKLDVPAPDELAAARAVSGIRVALDCAYCKGAIARREAAFCASCLAPHHEDCFRAHRRCSTYGCDETRLVRPKEAAGEPVTTSPRPAEPSRLRRIASPLVIATLGGLVAAAAVVGVKGRLAESNLVSDVGERRAAELLVSANEKFASHSAAQALQDLASARAALPAGPSALRTRLEDRTIDFLLGEARRQRDVKNWDSAEYWLAEAERLEFAAPRAREIDALRAEIGATKEMVEKERAEAHARLLRDNAPVKQCPRHAAPTLSGLVYAGKVSLSWTASPEDQYLRITNEELFRRDVGETAWEKIAVLAPGKTTYDDPGAPERLREYRLVETAATDADDPVIARDKTELDPKDSEKTSNEWRTPEHPDQLWSEAAEKAIASGSVGDALNALTHAIELSPREPAHRLARARVKASHWSEALGKSGDKDALDDVQIAIELAPRAPDAWFLRAELELDAGLLAWALRDANEAVLASKDGVRALLLRAKILQASGDPTSALADIDKAVALDPTNFDALDARSEARAAAHDVKGQIEDLTKLIELSSKRGKRFVHLTRGMARRKLGELTGALEDFNAFVEADPTSAKGWRLRAEVLFEKGDWDGAVADATKAIEIEPNTATLLLRAEASLAKGDLDGAALDASAVLSRPGSKTGDADTNLAATRVRGLARAKKGYASGAREDLDLVAAGLSSTDPGLGPVLDALDSLAPVTTASLVARAEERTSHGDPDRAIAAATRALELDPRLGDAYYWRATARCKKGDTTGSVADALEATKLDPTRVVFWRVRGQALMKAGDLPGALAALERANELQPETAEIWHELANVHALEGDWPKARIAIDRAARLAKGTSPAIGVDQVRVLVQVGDFFHALSVKGDLPATSLLEIGTAAFAKASREDKDKGPFSPYGAAVNALERFLEATEHGRVVTTSTAAGATVTVEVRSASEVADRAEAERMLHVLRGGEK